MLKRRVVSLLLVSVLLIWTLAGSFVMGASADGPLYHTVQYRDTITSIARRYGVSVQDLTAANHLTNPHIIVVGQKLLIPGQTDVYTIHVVSPGETMLRIAARYGVSVWAIAIRNGIVYPNLIYPGQQLVIPGAAPVPGPTPTPPATPAKPVVQEGIIISSPLANADVRCPITVTGWGSGFENNLAVDVLDSDGHTIAQGYAMITADVGGYGPFVGSLNCTTPITVAQVGRVQVYSISPRDGAIEHLASVTVNLRP
jgi:LysM repeat protein